MGPRARHPHAGVSAFNEKLMLGRRDPELIARVLPALEWFNRTYLRLHVDGAEHVGREPAIYVGNHNGGIMGPDLSCTLATLWRLLTPNAPLYAMAHDFAMKQLTPLGSLLERFGAVRASQSNARRLLESGGQLLVYPGGDLDAYRHFRRRNEVVIAPRTGFVKIAQAASVPIVPIVAHGAHRSAIIFSEGKRIATHLRMQRWARLTRFPLALALPWGFVAGPWLPYLPLPFPIRLRVLAPIRVLPTDDAREAAHAIQSTMQRALDAMAS
jgi:1-acyl-sn-glycerol-3-phosphate acyltransferase